MANKNNARLPDINTLLQAGFDPNTGLPFRYEGSEPKFLEEGIRRFISQIDLQDAIRRYTWYNLPDDIDAELLERILYFRGQGAFFFAYGKFYFLPFTMGSDGIDIYGRYKSIIPLPFTGTSEASADKLLKNESTKWMTGLTFNVLNSLLLEDIDFDQRETFAVLLHDYSRGISQTILPRQELNRPIINAMAECVPYMRTNLINATGIKGMRVADADQKSQVEMAAKSVEMAAKTGKPWIPVIGDLEFQDLGNGTVSKSEEYMLAMQSLDNLRLSGYGIKNGGLFEKKAHELQTEADINGGPVGLIYQDGLTIRQEFCDRVNSLFGLGIWCDSSENQSGFDQNMDGRLQDEEGGNASGSVSTGVSDETDDGSME